VWLIRGAYDAVAGAMSGVGDLVAAIAIFAALCYLLFRLARGILAKRA
jgi:flagellar biogenesis protein FliO